MGSPNASMPDEVRNSAAWRMRAVSLESLKAAADGSPADG
jgi:hypothetical protein